VLRPRAVTGQDALDGDLARLVAGVRGSLVRVLTGSSGAGGAGAGTIWHPRGLILTAAHVVERTPVRVVLPSGAELPADVVAHDRRRDLAALRVDADDLPAIELGAARSLRPGSVVVAVGHPWGVEGAVTAGVVIAPPGEMGPSGEPSRWLVADLHLRPGHSGGPVVDPAGRLVGICTMMNGPAVGVAVPVEAAFEFLRAAMPRRGAVGRKGGGGVLV
jgi:serine protease Do